MFEAIEEHCDNGNEAGQLGKNAYFGLIMRTLREFETKYNTGG